MDISDVMIHIDENLIPSQRLELENEMRSLDGVIAPRFNANKDHLLLIAFDPKTVNTDTLLHRVTEHGYNAQLVGV